MLRVLGIAVAAVVMVAGNALALTAQDLVGTWTIVSLTGDPYGPNPKGYLIFDANGRFIQLLTRPDLSKFAANKRDQGTAEEYKAAYLGTLGFFGTYTVNVTELTRHVEGSEYPNMIGTDQKLTVTLTGDELKYSNPNPVAESSPIVVVWKRAK
jgi:hypothetical protein